MMKKMEDLQSREKLIENVLESAQVRVMLYLQGQGFVKRPFTNVKDGVVPSFENSWIGTANYVKLPDTKLFDIDGEEHQSFQENNVHESLNVTQGYKYITLGPGKEIEVIRDNILGKLFGKAKSSKVRKFFHATKKEKTEELNENVTTDYVFFTYYANPLSALRVDGRDTGQVGIELKIRKEYADDLLDAIKRDMSVWRELCSKATNAAWGFETNMDQFMGPGGPKVSDLRRVFGDAMKIHITDSRVGKQGGKFVFDKNNLFSSFSGDSSLEKTG